MGSFRFTPVLFTSLTATEANSGTENQFITTLKLTRDSVPYLQKKAGFLYIFPTSVLENDLLHEPAPISTYLCKAWGGTHLR